MKCVYCQSEDVEENKTPDGKVFYSCNNCSESFYLPEKEVKKVEPSKDIEPTPSTSEEIKTEQPTVEVAPKTKKEKKKKPIEPKKKGLIERFEEILNKDI